jgi:hypothetical protein
LSNSSLTSSFAVFICIVPFRRELAGKPDGERHHAGMEGTFLEFEVLWLSPAYIIRISPDGLNIQEVNRRPVFSMGKTVATKGWLEWS